MRLLVTILLCMVCGGSLFAQHTVTVKASATYEAPLTMSPIEAEYETIRRAQVEAIAKEFGTVITKESQNFMRENSTVSYDDFFSYSEADVRGIWLETLGDTVWQTPVRMGGFIQYGVSLRGKIREIESVAPDVHYTFMYNGTDPKANRLRNNSFNEGDQLYFNFSSPVEGYLALYLVDHNNSMTTQRLLPYAGQKSGAYHIKPDTTYTFFSYPDAEPMVSEYTQELMLGCLSEHDYNQFYIIFSPNPFTRANDKNTADINSRQLPPSTDYRSFQKWLSRIRRHDKDMFVEKLLVDIVKP